MRDITEHITKKTELEKSQVILNSIINSTSDLIWSVNPRDFGLIMFNRGLYEYFLDKRGISIKVGMRPEDLFPTDEYVQIWRGFYQRALEEGSYTTEYSIFSGTDTLDLRINVLKQNNKVIGLLVFGRDITAQKMTEKALLETKKYWQSLVENTSDVITVLDTNAIILYQNPAVERILGYKPNELIGKNASEFVHPEDWPRCWEMIAAYMSSPESLPPLVEFRNCQKDGSWRIMETTGEVRINETGQKVAVLTSRDVTERKVIEKELKESEARYRQIFETTTEGIWVMDRDHRTTFVNERMATMLGYNPAEIIGKQVEDFMFEEDLPAYQERMAQRQSGVGGGNYENRFRSGDGNTLWTIVSVTVLTHAKGGYDGSYAMVTDITERKLAEIALQESEMRFRTLNENTFVGVQLLQDGVMTYVNSTLAKMFGYLPAELIGADPLVLTHSDDHALVTENIRRLISGEIKNLQYEFHGICKNGNSKNIEVIGMGIILDGRPAIIGNALDVTARKQAEEALRFERDFAEGVIETAQTIVLVLDNQGCIVRFNPYMEEISGYALAEVQGKDWIGTFVPERYRESTRKLFQKALEDIYSRGNMSPIVAKDGREREIEWYNKTLRDMQGNIVYLLSIGQDITEHKQVEESLRHLSTHDAMTGLYNHGFFVEEMARLERGRNFPVSIILADVDHLKQTNDQYGHAVGDALLKHIAQVLSAAFRAEDVVARVGGDEFAVLLPSTNANSAKTSLQRVQKIIQENNINHKVPPIRLSLGVSTAGSPTPLGGVLKEADANMYREKRGHDDS